MNKYGHSKHTATVQVGGRRDADEEKTKGTGLITVREDSNPIVKKTNLSENTSKSPNGDHISSEEVPNKKTTELTVEGTLIEGTALPNNQVNQENATDIQKTKEHTSQLNRKRQYEKLSSREASSNNHEEELGQRPTFTLPPEPVLTDERETIQLTCRVSGSILLETIPLDVLFQGLYKFF